MPLAASSRLGPYEVLSLLGAGGMGEVYKARDTRLDRLVAIKVLPNHLFDRADLRERFQREARAISSLSHPNVCALFDVGVHDGQDYIVMEYLDGESLADRVAHGPLPMEETYRYGIEIAEALDAAHRHGVIHRDLKPGNIVITKSGAKLLDFGLAKTRPAGLQPSASSAATAVNPITQEGTVMGTLQYMAPEQLHGNECDARSDIFALGAILYELATGARAFRGSTQPALAAAILKEPVPPPSARQPLSSPEFDRIVRKSLEKDPDARWQSAGDLADELRWVRGLSGEVRTHNAAARTSTLLRAFLVLGAIAAIAAAATVGWRLHGTAPNKAPERRFSIEVPTHGSSIPQLATYNELAVSPDGTKVAFVAVSNVQSSIWVRSLDSVEARQIEGTSGGRSPFWSPDSRTLGFFAGGELKRVASAGGSVSTICKGNGGSATWGPGDQILFSVWGADDPGTGAIPEARRAALQATNAIHSVAAAGGTPHAVTAGDQWDMWPQFFPDGKHVLFFRNYGPADPRTGLYAQLLSGGNIQLLVRTLSKGLIASDNRLFYVQDGILVSQELDTVALKVIGEPRPVAKAVFFVGPTGSADFSISDDHSVIAYLRAQLPTELKWMDRNGRDLGSLGPPAICSNFRVAPDDSRVIEEITDPRRSTHDLWLLDVKRKALSRITDEAQGAYAAIWDSKRNQVISSLASQDPTSAPQIHIVPLDGRPRLPLSRRDGPQYATAVTPDGAEVIYAVARGADSDIERKPIGEGNATPVLNSHFDETQGVISPDGKWIAYVSDESGRLEVYVQPFKEKGERVQISSAGGFEPRWSKDGTELYFVDLFQTLNSVPVIFSPTFKPGDASKLFRINSAGMMEYGEFGDTHYDVTSSNQRFLVRTLPAEGDAPPIGVILNWNAAKRVDE
jgi:Tol biopolymer transport system component/predicted Ser/Thr protein kinase